MLPEERQIIWGSFDVSEQHEEMVKEDFFNYVCWTSRQMRYKNRRGLDPQVKMFLDQEHIALSPEWNLPIPNEAAAYKSLAKYGKAEVILQEEQLKKLNKAWEWTERHFMPYMGNSQVLSLREAVDRLDMSSSSGFPFNREFPTKRELFENDDEIMEWLEEDWERMAEDPMWTTVFSSSLKEELRLQIKIDMNSQRTFTAGAADATVQGNRLFVDQNEKMYAAHTKSSSAIGMSPLKGNWDKLYRKLDVFENGYALDEKEYDSSIRAFLMWGCAQLRWKMLAPEFKTEANFHRIRVYYRNLINTLVLTPEGIMVMKKLGMPSGCVSTVTDNTIILYTLLAYAWIMNCPDEWCSYEAFEDNTAKALVGDDNTWTVSDDAHKFYNAYTVIDTWKTLGITTTTDCMEPRRACELDFLSAHTVFIKGIAVPLYSRDKLMTSLLFAPQSHITPATTLQRCTNLLQIGWSDLVFRDFCRGLIAWLLQEYDDVLRDDPRWIVAKSSIMTDEVYFTLFTNRKSYFVTPQSYYETQERLEMHNNKALYPIMSNQPQKQQQKKRGGARGPKKGKKQQNPQKQNQKPKKVAIVSTRGGKPRRRGRNTGFRSAGNNQRADTSSKYGGAPMITNIRKISKPEPFSGDELIGTVVGSVAYATTQYSLNPGNPTTFPWFNKIAQLYERYKFTMLEAYFQHDVSQFNAQGAAGLVLLSTLYDAASAAPTTKQQIEATDPHVICMPNENACLKLALQGMHPVGEPKFVRGASLPGATDIKTYDVGNLFVTTQGMAAGTEIGELHIRYKGLLYDRILDSSTSAAPQNFSVSQFSDTAPTSLTSTVASIPPLAVVTVNGLAIPNVAGVFTPPAGNYLIDWRTTGVATTSITQLISSLQKNGVTQPGVGGALVIGAAAVATQLAYTGNAYLSFNGTTDNCNLLVNETFTGTGTQTSGIRFVAI